MEALLVIYKRYVLDGSVFYQTNDTKRELLISIFSFFFFTYRNKEVCNQTKNVFLNDVVTQ